jgi:hypothetical protein
LHEQKKIERLLCQSRYEATRNEPRKSSQENCLAVRHGHYFKVPKCFAPVEQVVYGRDPS